MAAIGRLVLALLRNGETTAPETPVLQAAAFREVKGDHPVTPAGDAYVTTSQPDMPGTERLWRLFVIVEMLRPCHSRVRAEHSEIRQEISVSPAPA